VRRQRTDFQHQTALALLPQYDVISLQDVQVRPLVRTHHLAKRSSDARWSMPVGRCPLVDARWAALRTILTSKAVWAGKRVMAVPPAYTSQECRGGGECGERVPQSLRVRTQVCPCGGLVIARDENAALNMLRAGQARQGAVAVAAVVN
jgi:putative transposase